MNSTLISDLDVYTLRRHFPVLDRKVRNDKPLVYLDNAATAQKPDVVISSLQHYYENHNANIHRGIHTLAEEATAAYEAARDTIQNFINADRREEIIFTSGVTEGINLVAACWGRHFIQAGDEIIITAMEHHSNIVPWQMLCEEKGAVLKVIPVDEAGDIIWDEMERLITQKTKLISVVHISNALGTVNPVKDIVRRAHEQNITVLVDGAQSSVHDTIDVQDIKCDFFVFSSHKLYGPTGVGVLYGKYDLLYSMPPYKGGGEMIKEVSFDKTTYNELPYKFEAGTPNIADVIAFKKAIDFVTETGRSIITKHEESILTYAHEKLAQIKGIRFIGTAKKKAGVVSFLVDGTHPQDIGILLDNYGIAVRTGHHCAQPLMNRFGIPGTVRASFAMYTTTEEIDVLSSGVQKAIKLLT
jgi:cysteine desulfurase/selenocysteine lyase